MTNDNWRAAVLVEFKAGKSMEDIAVEHGLPYSLVDDVIRDALKRQAMP